MQKTRFSQKLSYLEVWSLLTTYCTWLYMVVHGLFKEPNIGPLRSKMAEIRHLGSSRQNAKKRDFLKN